MTSIALLRYELDVCLLIKTEIEFFHDVIIEMGLLVHIMHCIIGMILCIHKTFIGTA